MNTQITQISQRACLSRHKCHFINKTNTSLPSRLIDFLFPSLCSDERSCATKLQQQLQIFCIFIEPKI